MGSIMVGIPFIAFVAHFCLSKKGFEAIYCCRRKAFKGDPKLGRKLRRLSILDDIGKLASQVRHSASFLRLFSKRDLNSDEDVDPAQEFFQKLQKKGWELLKDDILGGNEYLQLFQPADGYSRAVTVARVLVVLFTIMFWDCTICAVVFPPGYSDCYWIASEGECVNSDLICGWDPYSQGCAPYSLEDTPGTMLYVSALTLAITIPIMAFLEWFIVHTIEAEIPQQDKEGGEIAIEEGDYLAGEGWTFPTSSGETSPAPCLGPEEIKKKTNLPAPRSPSHQPGLDGNLLLSLSAGGFAQQYQQNKEKDGSWVFPESVKGGSHGLLSSRSSKNSSRAFMQRASRKELLDHRKPWLNSELVDNLVEERLAARATSRTYMCIRWLGLGKLLRKAIHRDVVLTLNLQERIAQAHEYPEDQDALLFEAAWCEVMGDHMFALLHKYTVREDEDSGSGELICCLKPQLTQQAVFRRKVLGWVSLLIYCIVCGFYVCLFGVNYGEDYSVGWFKAFAVGFAEDMVLLSPMLAVSTFIAGRALARRPSLKALRSLANRPANSHKSAVVLAAMRHPDLTVSKVLLDPFFEPPLSWQKRYNLQVDTNDAKYCRLRRWLWGVFLFVAVAFLTLPPDIQGTLVQGSGVLALYYGAAFCFANSSGGRKGSVYGIVVITAISVLYLWGYVLMPRERLNAFWNYMKTQLLPSFKKTQTQSRSPTIQNLISRNGLKDSSTAFSKQNQEQRQDPISSSWSCEEGETSPTTKKLGRTLELFNS
uniref:Uncharacterized protein n=1 Tax=Heterosigma akashiwo TaxID=2829 RepID=A0A7S3Y5Z2_HETAK